VGAGGSIRGLHQSFMASTAHRRNNLYRKYDRVGVGVVRRGARIWITVIFAG
jgi:uncharacterized protein YkwD